MTTATGLPLVIVSGVGDSPRAIQSPRSALDRLFRVVLMGCAGTVVLLIFAIILFLAQKAWPVLQSSGLSFFTTSVWRPGAMGQYGILGDLVGTLTVAVV